MHKKYFQFFTLVLVILLILNLVLLAMKKIDEIYFWIIIAIVAVFSYIILPKLKKKLQ